MMLCGIVKDAFHASHIATRTIGRLNSNPGRYSIEICPVCHATVVRAKAAAGCNTQTMGTMFHLDVGRMTLGQDISLRSILPSQWRRHAYGFIIRCIVVHQPLDAIGHAVSGIERRMRQVKATIDNTHQHATTVVALRQFRSGIDRPAVHPLWRHVVHQSPAELCLYAFHPVISSHDRHL